MKRALIAPILVALCTTAALGQNANAPGQDRTCLLTFKNPVASYSGNNFPDADVTESKWLPRKAAEAQAGQNPNMKTFEYGDDPLVVGPNGQYASAEELCNEHFN